VLVTGDRRAATLQAIMDLNRTHDGPPVRPARIQAAEAVWRVPRPLEFYVDFETVSDLEDDFTHIPEKGGQPLIFMIGCGHLEDGQWRWACLIADQPTPACEGEIIDRWTQHMQEIRQQLDPGGGAPLVFHWSPAEQSTFQTAFNSACERHPEMAWAPPAWFDLLKEVVREEPVVVRGALSFGLKEIATALHGLGLIETQWDSGPADGLGAMVGAWSCAGEAQEKGGHLQDTALMVQIAQYNQVDCKAMMEILQYLRRNH
jgi:hypothetical protein